MLIKSNKGRYKSLVDLNSKSNLDKKVYGSHHHMGGTRMGVDPRVSVVDSNLKVHGVDNLYVTGSSVFTTSGISNPTLTIIQLSLRLASYLESI